MRDRPPQPAWTDERAGARVQTLFRLLFFYASVRVELEHAAKVTEHEGRLESDMTIDAELRGMSDMSALGHFGSASELGGRSV